MQASIEQFDFNHSGGMSMTKIASWLMVITAVMPAVLGGKGSRTNMAATAIV